MDATSPVRTGGARIHRLRARVVARDGAARAFAAALAILTAGCDRDSTAPIVPAPPVGQAASALEPELVPEFREATVRWDEARRFGREHGLRAAPDAARTAWKDVALPILVPPGALPSGIATGERTWYAISAPFEGGTLYASGGIVETVLPDRGAPSVLPSLSEPRLTVNELIPEAEVSAFGAHYAVSFECARPSEDPRCADTAFVAALVRDLVLIETAALAGGEVGP